ncbi:short-chain collagen C4-like isoform X1 [Mercenaria mercenaria]|uniref:short-chain collagen C4-like isoform X1 n=1 Tax=Mercenaria mercenaria TaxID=6596 RepID=UPI00234F2483|nr:short-chain collagen C4-like isoform X1 [Mercenaria mercenaria]
MTFLFPFRHPLVFLSVLLTVSSSDYVEEKPCSRFDFDHKLLESLVRLEHSHTSIREEMEKLKSSTWKIPPGENQASTGGTYVRWGRTVCPENATITYKGYAGGSLYSDPGSASNYLCLPEDPQASEKTKDDNTRGSIGARVYGAEYQMDFFSGNILQDDVPCAVCESERSKILMIPGRTTCYDGWSTEYSGLLSAGHFSHAAASEFVCLDENPEVLSGGGANENGKLFFLAEARCGSLPCPPYVDGRTLTCVVCSK